MAAVGWLGTLRAVVTRDRSLRVNWVGCGRRLALINCILLLVLCGLITVSITIIVITVNLDLAFCVVCHRVTGTLLPGGGRCCCRAGVCLSAAACRRAQTLQVVNRLGDEGVREGSFGRHPHVKLPLDAFIYEVYEVLVVAVEQCSQVLVAR